MFKKAPRLFEQEKTATSASSDSLVQCSRIIHCDSGHGLSHNYTCFEGQPGNGKMAQSDQEIEKGVIA
jgi:hypothetical protein